MIRFRKGYTGFTLIELLITIAVVAILAALAAPSYSTFIEKRKITGGAEEIAAFMGLARSEAVKHNLRTTVNVTRTDGTNWCLGMMFGNSACDCTSSTAADADYCALKYADNGGTAVVETQLISSSGYSGFELTGDTTATTITYDPIRGILASAGDASSITVQSENGKYELTVNISVTGTVKICTKSTKKVTGFKSCS